MGEKSELKDDRTDLVQTVRMRGRGLPGILRGRTVWTIKEYRSESPMLVVRWEGLPRKVGGKAFPGEVPGEQLLSEGRTCRLCTGCGDWVLRDGSGGTCTVFCLSGISDTQVSVLVVGAGTEKSRGSGPIPFKIVPSLPRHTPPWRVMVVTISSN